MNSTNNMPKKNQQSPETFIVWSDEVIGRLDPFFYRPVFKQLIAPINDTKHEAIPLGDIVEFSIAGDWGEDPNTFEPNPNYTLCNVLRNTNFDNKYNFNFDDVAQRYVRNDKVEKLALQKGEILIEKSGGSPVQPVGRVAFVEELPFENPVVFSNFLQKIKIADNEFFPEYVFTYLQAIYHLGYTEFLQNQTTGIKNLRLDDFFNIRVIKLPKSEQKKVAKLAFDIREEVKQLEVQALEVLDSIDDYVLGELGIKLEPEEEQMTFEIWSDEITERIDPSFFRPIFETLDNAFATTKYKTGTLSDLSLKITSGATPLSKGDAYINADTGVPFVRSGDINMDNKIDFENLLYLKPEVHNKKLKGSQLQKGDLLIAIVGATIGQISVYEDDKEANINQAIALVRLNKNEINPEFAKEFLFSTIGQMQLDRIKRPVARANINLNEAGNMKIICPVKQKQDEMVRRIKKIRTRANTLFAEADKLVASTQKQVEKMILA